MVFFGFGYYQPWKRPPNQTGVHSVSKLLNPLFEMLQPHQSFIIQQHSRPLSRPDKKNQSSSSNRLVSPTQLRGGGSSEAGPTHAWQPGRGGGGITFHPYYILPLGTRRREKRHVTLAAVLLCKNTVCKKECEYLGYSTRGHPPVESLLPRQVGSCPPTTSKYWNPVKVSLYPATYVQLQGFSFSFFLLFSSFPRASQQSGPAIFQALRHCPWTELHAEL